MKLEADGAHAHGVDHPPYRRTTAVTRQCLGCGVVAIVDPTKPCPACGVSHFNLIPERRELANW